MQVFYSSRFSRQYKKLSQEIRIKASEKEIIFRTNPFARQLNTHKLGGDLSGLWAFSVDYKTRIIFEFISSDEIRFHTIGGHEVY